MPDLFFKKERGDLQQEMSLSAVAKCTLLLKFKVSAVHLAASRKSDVAVMLMDLPQGTRSDSGLPDDRISVLILNIFQANFITTHDISEYKQGFPCDPPSGHVLIHFSVCTSA